MHARNIRWICFGLLLLSFPIVHAELWHVWFMLKNCSTVAVRSQVRHQDYMKNAAALIGQKEAHKAENHVEFRREKLLNFYSRTSPGKSIFCTVIPQINEIKIDVYAPEKSFDREAFKVFTADHFDATTIEQTTQYFSD